MKKRKLGKLGTNRAQWKDKHLVKNGALFFS